MAIDALLDAVLPRLWQEHGLGCDLLWLLSRNLLVMVMASCRYGDMNIATMMTTRQKGTL
jgi:hypothetical protein